jgi:hypothetical protein
MLDCAGHPGGITRTVPARCIGITLTAMLVVIATLAVACDRTDQRSPPPSPVPQTAQRMSTDSMLGDTTADGTERALLSFECDDDLLTITTSIETIYALFPCTGAPDQDWLEPFLGQPLAIVVDANDVTRVHLRPVTGGSIEFSTGGIWHEPSAE